jgi:hypothetical protein
MKNRMLRGNAAPTGFAASVSEWLRTYVYRQRSAGVTINQRARLDMLDSCASLPVGLGDDDPRIRAIALASPGNRWEPGQNRLAVIDAAGERIPGDDAPTLKPDDLLAALTHAAALDIALAHGREIAHIKKGEEAAPTHEAMLQFERDRADTEAAARKELQRENGNLRDEVIRVKARARRAEAVVMGAEQVEPTETVAAPPALPKNVRRRGDRFQGYLKRDGETISQTFDTPEEAAGWVAEQQNQIAREKLVSEAQHPREFNPSPEELAAMQERAAA